MQPELMRVPSVAELVATGGAEVVERNKKGEATIYKLLPQGADTISHAMLHNGKILRADEVRRKQREQDTIRIAKQNGSDSGKRPTRRGSES